MEQLTTATLTQLPQVRALGRHTGRDPLTLFWTASGMELEFTGSELWVDLFADYEMVEPWVSVELNGAWVARFAVNPGKSRICLFRGMTPGKAKHLRLLKDVQAIGTVQFKGLGVPPTGILQRKWCLYRQTYCLQML